MSRHPRAVNALRDAAGPDILVSSCTTATGLLRLASTQVSIAAVVVELDAPDNSAALSLIAEVHRRCPRVRIIVSLPSTLDMCHAAFRAGQLGAHYIVTNLEDPPGALRRVVRDAASWSFAAIAIEQLGSAAPPKAREFIHRCLTQDPRGARVQEGATAMREDRRALARHFRNGGLPEPRIIAGWCRLLHVARFLDDPTRAIHNIAEELGHESSGAVYNLVRRYTGMTPGDLRTAGAVTTVLTLFRKQFDGTGRREPVLPSRSFTYALGTSADVVGPYARGAPDGVAPLGPF